MNRLEWDEYFLGIAKAVSRRGDCTRRQIGAVLVDQDHHIISTGYNGTVPGQPGCLSGACPRGCHHNIALDGGPGECACGAAWPCEDAVQPGSSYDTGPGACISLHAEQNCLLYAFTSVSEMMMYISDEPCDGCLKLMRGARISCVVTPLRVLR
jgi:dCMP deaminase